MYLVPDWSFQGNGRSFSVSAMRARHVWSTFKLVRVPGLSYGFNITTRQFEVFVPKGVHIGWYNVYAMLGWFVQTQHRTCSLHFVPSRYIRKVFRSL